MKRLRSFLGEMPARSKKGEGTGVGEERLQSRYRPESCERREGSGGGWGRVSLRLHCISEKVTARPLGSLRARVAHWETPGRNDLTQVPSPRFSICWQLHGLSVNAEWI